MSEPRERESRKVIWVPKSETTATVVDGTVYVSTSMLMEPKQLGKETGFAREEEK